VTLTCLTSCHPATTVWFKDGLPVARTQFQARAEDSGNYVCAVKGVESVLSDPVALDVQCKYVYYDRLRNSYFSDLAGIVPLL